MKVSAETLQALEFSFVREMLAERTVTPMGRPLALELGPLESGPAILEALDETDEARRLIEAQGSVPLRGVSPLEGILGSLGIEGTVLAAREIHDVASFCEIVEGARAFGRKIRGEFPGIGGRAAALPSLGPLADMILGKVSPAGELEDSASPALARIRARIHSATATIHQRLEGILHGRDASKFLSDAFITQRGGRFVIPVRADAPEPPRGIVHGGSSSGATLFVEPLPTVELNNELVRLQEEEAAEIERILRAWTEALQERLPEIDAAAVIVAALDLAQAKARLAKDFHCARPEIVEGGPLALAAARHPLLERTLSSSGGRIVPVDVAIPPGTTTLIVSGPNAGGKTVVLKTSGLLALMAHAGLHVPAAEAKLPLLRRILVDIGDRQSIEGSLSTFSAHIQNLSGMTRELDPPCLVLIDEIGTGTDPGEGGALAISLLEWFREHGAVTIATTHHGQVRIYGIETPAVASAAVEFDEVTLAPTYRLLAGIAGASSGLAIAERLGLDARIVTAARDRLDPGAREAEQYLLQLRGLVSSLEDDRRELEKLRVKLEADTRRAREAAIRSDHERAERFRGELARALEEFRAAARALTAGLADRKEAIRLDRERARVESELRRRADALERAAEPEEPLPGGGRGGAAGRRGRPRDAGGGAGEEAAPFELKTGITVLVGPYGREAKVESIEGDAVTVLVGAARFRVRRGDCGPPESAVPTPRWKAGARSAADEAAIEKAGAPREINLIGLVVEEAIERVDKFVDDAVLAGHSEVRIIHGHGTGRLKRAVRAFLSKSPHVAAHRPGGPNEGGDGATVATLTT